MQLYLWSWERKPFAIYESLVLYQSIEPSSFRRSLVLIFLCFRFLFTGWLDIFVIEHCTEQYDHFIFLLVLGNNCCFSLKSIYVTEKLSTFRDLRSSQQLRCIFLIVQLSVSFFLQIFSLNSYGKVRKLSEVIFLPFLLKESDSFWATVVLNFEARRWQGSLSL